MLQKVVNVLPAGNIIKARFDLREMEAEAQDEEEGGRRRKKTEEDAEERCSAFSDAALASTS